MPDLTRTILPLALLALMLAPLPGSSAQAPVRDTGLDAEFHFTRMAFGSGGGSFTRYRNEPWLRDWPEAEFHFMQGVRRLTRVDAGGENRQVGLLEDALFDYPLLYAVKVGFWNLRPQEVERLRAYLLRGGTLVVDDFHGPDEWAQFNSSLSRVLPDRPVVDLPDDHEVFHVLFDLDDRVQIGGINAVLRGVSWEDRRGVPEYWRGVLDDDGRVMVLINFNMDLGDAWEHADDAAYPEPLTALAYRIGINYLIYAMTR